MSARTSSDHSGRMSAKRSWILYFQIRQIEIMIPYNGKVGSFIVLNKSSLFARLNANTLTVYDGLACKILGDINSMYIRKKNYRREMKPSSKHSFARGSLT